MLSPLGWFSYVRLYSKIWRVKVFFRLPLLMHLTKLCTLVEISSLDADFNFLPNSSAAASSSTTINSSYYPNAFYGGDSNSPIKLPAPKCVGFFDRRLSPFFYILPTTVRLFSRVALPGRPPAGPAHLLVLVPSGGFLRKGNSRPMIHLFLHANGIPVVKWSKTRTELLFHTYSHATELI
jgi:hypothetical protein